MKQQLPKAIRNEKALHQHWTHRGGKMVPKVQFKTLDEALAFMKRRHLLKRYHPYVCSDCGMWHIGHNKTAK